MARSDREPNAYQKKLLDEAIKKYFPELKGEKITVEYRYENKKFGATVSFIGDNGYPKIALFDFHEGREDIWHCYRDWRD